MGVFALRMCDEMNPVWRGEGVEDRPSSDEVIDPSRQDQIKDSSTRTLLSELSQSTQIVITPCKAIGMEGHAQILSVNSPETE